MRSALTTREQVVPGAYKRGTSLGRPSSRWQDTIKAYPKEMGGGMGGLDSCGLGYERVKGCFEYGNAPGAYRKCGEFLD